MGKHIKKYQSVASAKSDTLYSPTVIKITENGDSVTLCGRLKDGETKLELTGDTVNGINFDNKIDYLSFKCESESGYISMTHNGTNETTTKPNIEYKLNNADWVEWNYSQINIVLGDVVKMRGYNPNGISSSNPNYSNFVLNGNISSYGNITTLLDKIGKQDYVTSYCYYHLFYNCSTLMSTPKLPATTLASECYYGMFSNCSNLTTAPTLPVTTLANCCYSYMFHNCTSLTQTPTLPATTLANYCYDSMFSNCSSLTQAPELPATTLANYCYDSMFSNCTSLSYIKCLATNISASECTNKWVNNINSSGQFVVPNSMRSTWNSKSSGSGKPANFVYVDA